MVTGRVLYSLIETIIPLQIGKNGYSDRLGESMKVNIGNDIYLDRTFCQMIEPLIREEKVQEMRKYMSHGYTDCLTHSVYVAYIAYKIGKKRGFDYKALIRAGMLHDLYLYDWHHPSDRPGLHGMTHARLALHNALKIVKLNHMEKDIIEKHMWPLNPRLPKYHESVILMIADRYVSTLETLKIVPTQPRLYRKER